MDITIAQEGWRFVLTCFERFQGEGWFFLWFVAALGYLWWSDRRAGADDKEISQRSMIRWCLPYVVVLALTVFNVVFVRIVVSKLSMEDEYYRFLWLLPVTVVTGFAAARAVVRSRHWWMRMALIMVLSVTMLFTGKTILGRGFFLAENLYKVPDEVMEISRIIQEDAEAENPKVIAEFDLVVLLNQYDPSLSLEIAYGDVSTLRDVKKAPQASWDRWLTARLTVMDVVMERDLSISKWDFMAAMDYTDAYYLVASTDPVLEAYYTQARCVPIAMTEHYTVYRYYNTVLTMPGE